MMFASVASLAILQHASASVTLYEEYSTWTAASGPFTTVTFNEVPHPSILTNQYQDLGILFTSADPDVAGFFSNASDQAAVNGLDVIEITFAAPINEFAWLHPDATRIKLFSGDDLVYQSTYLGGSGWGWFSGLTSSVAFDRIQLNDFDQPNSVFVDNIYFSTIPAPGGAALIWLAGHFGGSRARRKP
jgi:hypothetical protein